MVYTFLSNYSCNKYCMFSWSCFLKLSDSTQRLPFVLNLTSTLSLDLTIRLFTIECAGSSSNFLLLAIKFDGYHFL